MKTLHAVLLGCVLPSLALAQTTGPATRTEVVDQGAQDPAVSPDRAQIALGILGKIWLVPIQGGPARQVSFGSSWDSHPAWSADGQCLAYAHQQPQRSELVVLNLATGGTRTLYSAETGVGAIAFHPTRPQILFISDIGQFDANLWSINVP